jgi:hypothetical protein
MDYKYEPLTRVKWLMEENDYTLEEAEKIASEPVCITEIAEVFWKIEGDSLVSPDYCFRTKEDIFIDEAEWATDEFRLDFHNGEYFIMALSDEDFHTSDDVTDQFDVQKILEACQAEEKSREGTDDPVENRYDEYMQFLEDQEEDELENTDYEEDDDSGLMMIDINL